MTIDEHFILMIILEALIFFVGMGLMYYQQKRTADYMERILSDPKYATDVATNMLFGAMQRILENKNKEADTFFGFVQLCGAHAVQGIKGKVAPEVSFKKNHPLKAFEGPLNQIIPNLLESFTGAFSNEAKKKAAEVGESAFDGMVG